jgi:hypothetical protein
MGAFSGSHTHFFQPLKHGATRVLGGWDRLYLRGDVSVTEQVPPSTHSSEGILFSGHSPHASIAQCLEFAEDCLSAWAKKTGKQPSEYIRSFHSVENANDLYSAAGFASELAWDAATIVATDSVAESCSNATEDDWWIWGWGMGPPDPLWQATRSEMEAAQADIARSVFRHPNISIPNTLRIWADRSIPSPAEQDGGGQPATRPELK